MRRHLVSFVVVIFAFSSFSLAASKSQAKAIKQTGILVIRTPDLNDDRYPTRYPVGSPLVPSIRFGLMPWAPTVFDGYYVQLGYQQEKISGDTDQTLKLANYTAPIGGENKFYIRGNMDLRYQVEMGLLQTQYHLQNSLSADLGLTYRNTLGILAKSEDFNLQPIGIGAEEFLIYGKTI
ncbi:MAG: hypothetical protein B7Y39_09405 [Bdellovibrio sp. 28-41-41]|nr:MAG: hypothetical protein B7Y39_09405 [Bdellovibrio sp. 28-41-41]